MVGTVEMINFALLHEVATKCSGKVSDKKVRLPFVNSEYIMRGCAMSVI